MNDIELDSLLREQLEARVEKLPSNFGYRVMQKIGVTRLRHARQRAIWESSLVSLLTAVVGVGVLVATAAFQGISLEISMLGGGLLPGLLILMGFFLIDTRLNVQGNDANSP